MGRELSEHPDRPTIVGLANPMALELPGLWQYRTATRQCQRMSVKGGVEALLDTNLGGLRRDLEDSCDLLAAPVPVIAWALAQRCIGRR